MRFIFSNALFLLLTALGFAAEPVIEFRGVMVGAGPTKLSLVDKTSDTTRWVEIGQIFMGYTVKGYDAAIETASLTRAGKEFRIRLNTSKIIEAADLPSAPALPPEQIRRAVLNNLRQIVAAADQYMMETGKNIAEIADLVGPEKYIKQLNPIDGEYYGGITIKPNQRAFSVSTRSAGAVGYDPSANADIIQLTPDQVTTEPVRAGDTAEAVAKRGGITPDQLQQLNPGVDFTKLKAGQTLRVH